MKINLLLLALFSISIFTAQEASIHPPVIVAKIPLGNTVQFENTSVTFLKVNEDSRCPSDVTCIWAGQAKISLSITSNEKTTEKELVFHGTQLGDEAQNTLFASETNTYIGYRLSPYPISTKPFGERKYKLEVFIK